SESASPRRVTNGELISGLMIAALLALNGYRAATQSLTHDEALTYNWFVNKTWGTVFHVYEANHHILYTILEKLSTRILGPSEFSIRLPSVIGGAIYFIAVFRIGRLVVGRGWKLIAWVALLSLNPFLLDFTSAARGYGLSIAFLTWSLME